MSRIEDRLRTLGFSLAATAHAAAGVVLPFRFVHVVGRRALISGHGPQRPTDRWRRSARWGAK
jgi:hypothetical protein